LAAALGLSGCGVTYVSPLVNHAAEDNVEVVPITLQTISVANSSPYVARRLPESFSQVAGTGSAPLRGAGSLPEPPVLPDFEPGQLELRVPPPAAPEPYRIGVGDVLQLASRSASTPAAQVSGAASGAEVRQEYTVRDDGAIALPDVGTIAVAGLTIAEAQQQVFDRFITSGLDANFSLEIAEFNSQSITVGGDVGSATVVPVTLNVPTLDQALTAAGGIQVDTPEFASIRIYRNGRLYQIPVESYQQRGDLRSIQLLPGDSIFVDTSYDLDRAFEYYQQQITLASLRRSDRAAALDELEAEIGIRRASLAEARELFSAGQEFSEENAQFVYLAGEVGDQGRYQMPIGRRATLADALFATGGGFETETGNPSQIYVLRLGNDPSQDSFVAWHLDVRNAVNLTLATRFEMRPDDVIFIEEQPITRWNRAFQQFFPTLLSSATNAVD
jgi:polysaccharide export outer membrane protein